MRGDNTTIKEIVEFFIKEGKEKPRLEILVELLTKHNLKVTTQQNHQATNVVVELGDRSLNKTIVIGGHYDVFPKSLGINDNTVAVAALIELAQKLKDTKYKIDIVFFDREESGFHGSSLYISTVGLQNIEYAIILDIIGYGDSPIITGASLTNTNRISTFKTLIAKNAFKVTENRLPSDNSIFMLNRIPAVLIVAIHDEDTLELDNGLVSISPAPEFYSSFHNGKNDNKIEIINWEIPELIINNLVRTFNV